MGALVRPISHFTGLKSCCLAYVHVPMRLNGLDALVKNFRRVHISLPVPRAVNDLCGGFSPLMCGCGLSLSYSSSTTGGMGGGVSPRGQPSPSSLGVTGLPPAHTTGHLPRRDLLLAFLAGTGDADDAMRKLVEAAPPAITPVDATVKKDESSRLMPLIAKATTRKRVWDDAGAVLMRWAADGPFRREDAAGNAEATRSALVGVALTVESERESRRQYYDDVGFDGVSSRGGGRGGGDDDEEVGMFGMFDAASKSDDAKRGDGEDVSLAHWWDHSPRSSINNRARQVTSLEERTAMWKWGTLVRELGQLLEGTQRRELPTAVRTLLAECAIRHAELGDAPAAFAMLALSERGVAAEGCPGGINAASSHVLARLVAWFCHHGDDVSALEAASDALRLGWELPEDHVVALLHAYAESRYSGGNSDDEVTIELISLHEKHAPLKSARGTAAVSSWCALVDLSCRHLFGGASSVTACRHLIAAMPFHAGRTSGNEVAAALASMVCAVAGKPLHATRAEASAAIAHAARTHLGISHEPMAETRPRPAALDRAAEVLVAAYVALDRHERGLFSLT